ncbi:MAG: ribonuclease Z [Clostridia bacterium]|nr:ribonuclease Z [Clostridia bacterium]
MKLIVCLDDKNGMMFNKRRQSRDKILIENVLELCKGEKLYTNEYSAKLFPENTVEICENPEEIENGYCFTENFTVNEDCVEEIIVYKWNRLYPADTYFNIDLENWTLTETVDFEGSSHEKITREIYVR